MAIASPDLIESLKANATEDHAPDPNASRATTTDAFLDDTPVESDGPAPSVLDALSKPRERKTATGRPKAPGKIAEGFAGLYGTIGMAAMPFVPNTAMAILSSAENIGQLYEELATTDPKIRAFLLKMLEGSAYSKLMMAHLPIAFALYGEVQEKRAAREAQRVQEWPEEAAQAYQEASAQSQGAPDLSNAFQSLSDVINAANVRASAQG